jgi:hypothetical protein
LQSLRSVDGGQEGPVLPDPRTKDASQDREAAPLIFPTPNDHDSGRDTKTVKSSVSGIPDDPADLRASALIKQIMAESAGDKYQDIPGRRMTNSEAIMRLLVDRALAGNQFALEIVLDRYEGKAVRAQQVNSQDHTVEELIDRQKVALLNGLVPAKRD